MQTKKFRGISVATDEWVYGDFILEKGFKPLIYTFNDKTFDPLVSGSGWEYVHVKTESVGMSTGLKDNNGVEIYKGDILRVSFGPFSCTRYAYSVGYVEYSNGQWLIVSTLEVPQDCEELIKPISKEIISNIYVDPELIQKTNNRNRC